MESIFDIVNNKDRENLKKYIMRGGDLNILDESGQNSLFYLVEKNDLEYFSLVLLQGADPQIKNNRGLSILMKAALIGNTALIRLILLFIEDQKKELLELDNKGRNILAYASIGKNSKTFEFLKSIGLNEGFLGKNEQGQGLLIHSSMTKPEKLLNNFHDIRIADTDLEFKSDIFELIQNFDFDFNKLDINFYQNFISSCLIRELDINESDDLGNRPLDYALLKNNKELVLVLASFGAELDYNNKEGDSPLTSAIKNNDELLSKILIKGGADPLFKTQNGETALDALKESDLDMEEFLKENAMCKEERAVRLAKQNEGLEKLLDQMGGGPPQENNIIDDLTSLNLLQTPKISSESIFKKEKVLVKDKSETHEKGLEDFESSNKENISHEDLNKRAIEDEVRGSTLGEYVQDDGNMKAEGYLQEDDSLEIKGTTQGEFKKSDGHMRASGTGEKESDYSKAETTYDEEKDIFKVKGKIKEHSTLTSKSSDSNGENQNNIFSGSREEQIDHEKATGGTFKKGEETIVKNVTAKVEEGKYDFKDTLDESDTINKLKDNIDESDTLNKLKDPTDESDTINKFKDVDQIQNDIVKVGKYKENITDHHHAKGGESSTEIKNKIENTTEHIDERKHAFKDTSNESEKFNKFKDVDTVQNDVLKVKGHQEEAKGEVNKHISTEVIDDGSIEIVDLKDPGKIDNSTKAEIERLKREQIYQENLKKKMEKESSKPLERLKEERDAQDKKKEEESVITKADIMKRNKKGQTSLLIFAQKGHVQGVKEVIALGADVNERDYVGKTALINAVNKGNTEIVKMLLEAGAKTETKDNKNNSALIYATTKMQKETIKLLLKHGASPDKRVKGLTLLMIAASQGEIETCKYFLLHGADPKVKDIKGRTAADFAEAAGKTELAKFMRQLQTSPPKVKKRY